MSSRIGTEWRVWLAGAVWAIGLAGCQGFFGTQGVPKDPLFVTRKPIEAEPYSGLVAVAFSEPAVPSDPLLGGPALPDHLAE